MERDRTGIVYDLCAPPLILVTPFISFVNYNDYSYGAPELWICLAGLLALGLLGGVVMALGGTWLRIVGFAGLVTLFVDLQFDLLDEQPWLRVPVFGVGMLLVCWILRDHLGRIATPVFATMLAATLIFPGASGESSFDNPDSMANGGAASDPTPPILVHLIFDEFIGVEGIPPDGHGAELKKELRTFFHANGFYLFGRAYSRFLYTRNAIPNALNYASPLKNRHFAQGKGPTRLRDNQYFKDMHGNGYDIHAYQTDFMDFCSGYERQVDSCRTFANTGIKPVEELELPHLTKSELIMKTFAKLSVIQRAFDYFHDVLRQEGLARGYHLPAWFLDTPSLAAARGLRALDIVTDDVATARAGEMFFVHVLLPHQPYMYKRACGVRDPDDWDENTEDEPLPPNTTRSRTRRYELYLEQISCVRTELEEMFERWRQAGVYQRMKIILQAITVHEFTCTSRPGATKTACFSPTIRMHSLRCSP